MPKRIPNPDLDRLVAELNRPHAAEGGREETPDGRNGATAEHSVVHRLGGRRVEVEAGDLERALERMVEQGASDLLLVAGRPAALRVHGDLVTDAGPAMTGRQIDLLFEPHLGPRHRHELQERGATDFSIRLATAGRAWRFRVNLHRQRGEPAAAVRALPSRIPTFDQLGLPAALADLVGARQGLVLVCGPTGAGKSTTLAALVGEVNRTRAAHVITIEDPVEYQHEDRRSLIEHVEIGQDAPSHAEALRAALRQDPDVILVGEMRDLETIATAVTAAETGHLILATLHTPDAVQAIHRIVDVFPPGSQGQVRHQLALSLRAIVAQELVPRVDGHGRVPAVEVLRATHPVRHLIRSQKLERLYNELVLGSRHGMITLEQSLAGLVRAGLVGPEEARLRARRPEELDSLLR